MEPPHISLAAETLFHIGPIPITNSFLVMLLVMAFLLALFTFLSRKITTDPSSGGRGGAFAETVVDFLLNLVESTGGKKLGRAIFPLVAALFIFIITSNFTGLLPGIGSIYYEPKEEAHVTDEHAEDEHATDEATQVASEAVHSESTPESDDHAASTADEHGDADSGDGVAGSVEEEAHHKQIPIFRPPTADLNMTLAMSTITFVAVQIFGVRAHGVGGRLKHMASPPFLFPIELVSEFSRIVSLAARLFGNVFAGEVLLGVAYSIANAVKIAVVPLLFPVIFLGLETIFGTIQALVFSLLTLIYIYLAAAGHDDHGEEQGENHDLVRTVDDQSDRHPAHGAAGD